MNKLYDQGAVLEFGHPAIIAMSVLSGFIEQSREFPFHGGSKRAALVIAPVFVELAELVRKEWPADSAKLPDYIEELHVVALNYVATVWQYEPVYAPALVTAQELCDAKLVGGAMAREVAGALFEYMGGRHAGTFATTMDALLTAVAFFISKHVKSECQSEFIFSLVVKGR